MDTKLGLGGGQQSDAPVDAAPPLRQRAAPAIAILPLRIFIGVTFIDAGMGKLLSPAYFGSGPQSFAALAKAFSHDTPLSAVVQAFVLPHPTLIGVLMAAGELTVGVLTLIGLATRIAAACGLLLSLSFFLTASWHTHPYFYGADLPFAFGWLTLLVAGSAGLPSVDGWMARRVRAEEGLPDGTEVRVPFDRLQRLCADADPRGVCAAAEGRACSGAHCALVRRDEAAAANASRRVVLQRGVLAGLSFAAAAAIGGIAAAFAGPGAPTGPGTGSFGNGASGATTTVPPKHPKASGSSGAPASSGSSAGVPAGATVLGRLSQVPVGQAATFTVPSNGDPAIAVRLTATDLVAFDAVCPHAGCTVGYDPSIKLLVCPCHGSEFNPAQRAAVVAGPSPRPLTPVPLGVTPKGTVYIV